MEYDMRRPSISRRTHEELQTEMANQVRSAAAAAEIRKLALRADVLLATVGAATGEPVTEEDARRRFRAPIKIIEAPAKNRFNAVAETVGLSQKAGREPYNRGGYFNFWPNRNTNVTRTIPIAQTPEGTIGVQLGTSWVLSKAKHSHLPESEGAFSARVVRLHDEEEPKEIGYVRLGRIFKRDALGRSPDHGASPDLSNYPGRVVLGRHEDLESDYASLVGKGAETEAQAALGRVELAVAAFTVLTEFAAVRAGVENHAVNADALILAINAVHRAPN
jgi:hypothetical protein